MSDDWKAAWQEVIDAVGQDFSDGQVHWGADVVEQSIIRRYCEPIELDSPLHYDADVARAHGYDGVIAPYTAGLTFAIPAMWSPGEPTLFDDDARDAQPARTPINNQDFPLGPKTTGFFATDMEMDFLRPVNLGERIGRRGHKLLSCTPKQTAVGRGAFMTWESEMVDQDLEVVVRMRTGTYSYVPLTSPDGATA
ncbi:MAG: MaoC family dehydratase N-terminal domain-containing protein [Actinoplanes sp.]